MRFVDTNILIYAVSSVSEDPEKRHRATELLRAKDLALSVQVLQEFYVQATHPSRPGALIHQEAVSFIEALQRFPIQTMTVGIMHTAMSMCHQFGLSYWDSAILAAAQACKCHVVYSEDMSSEQDYGGLSIVNPFV